MEKRLSLEATVREHTGSQEALKLRKQGRVPAIVYGHQQEPTAISLNAHDFVEGIHHGHRVMDIKIGRAKETMVIKDLQYDYLGKDVIHADLMRVNVTENVKVSVPIELKGTAKGTHEGGIIEEHADHLEVECLVTAIPDVIQVSVKDIGVGDVLHAGDITLPDGVKLVSSADTILVTCHLKAAAKTTEELEEEIPAAPEVIREAKKEEDASAEQ
jgi:large subunit ribosomal protein L25